MLVQMLQHTGILPPDLSPREQQTIASSLTTALDGVDPAALLSVMVDAEGDEQQGALIREDLLQALIVALDAAEDEEGSPRDHEQYGQAMQLLRQASSPPHQAGVAGDSRAEARSRRGGRLLEYVDRAQSRNSMGSQRYPASTGDVDDSQWGDELQEEEEEEAGSWRCLPVAQGWRGMLYATLSDTNSVTGNLISWLIMVCILLSVVAFCLESLPEHRLATLQGRAPAVFRWIETVCVAIFTVEYVGRVIGVTGTPPPGEDQVGAVDGADHSCIAETAGCCCCWSRRWHGCCVTPERRRRLWRHVREPMNLIDLAAILPFYVSLAVGGGTGALSVLRVLRLGRVLRIFKLGRTSTGMQVIGLALFQSMNALALTAFWICILIILYGSMIFFFEAGTYDEAAGMWLRPDVTGAELEQSPFLSIPASFWWVITTATTVGYGDMYPTSVGGKIVATFVMLSGVLILALPITIVGTNFNQAYAQMVMQQRQRRKAAKRRMRRRRQARASKRASPSTEGAFRQHSPSPR